MKTSAPLFQTLQVWVKWMAVRVKTPCATEIRPCGKLSILFLKVALQSSNWEAASENAMLAYEIRVIVDCKSCKILLEEDKAKSM